MKNCLLSGDDNICSTVSPRLDRNWPQCEYMDLNCNVMEFVMIFVKLAVEIGAVRSAGDSTVS